MPRQMKNSGITWIGDIPEQWQLGRIGHLYSERREKVSDRDFAPLSVTMQGVVPQLSTAAKTDAHDDRKLVRKGDFAINSRSDRRGSCGVSPCDGSVSLINTILSPHDDMDAGYYNWLFHTTMFADEYYKWGHGIVDDLWTTGWQDLKRISIPIPSLEEQERISNFLNQQCANIDSVLEQTRISIEEYKKLKQSIISKVVTSGIRGERSVRDSGDKWVGVIPKEWRITQLRHCASVKSGITLGKTYSDETELKEMPYLRVANVQDGYVDISNMAVLAVTDDEIEKYRLHAGDVLMTEGGDRDKLGRGCVWDARIDPCLHQNHIFAVKTNESLLNPYFLEYVTASKIGRTYFDVTAIKTTNLACTSSSKVMAFVIPLPSLEEQAEIVAYLKEKCDAIDNLISKKELVISELTNYKKSMIYEYVTGKKEVPQS